MSSIGVGVAVGVFVGVLVGVAVGVLVGVAVGVLVGVAVGVLVGVGIGLLASTVMLQALRNMIAVASSENTLCDRCAPMGASIICTNRLYCSLPASLETVDPWKQLQIVSQCASTLC